MSEFKGFDSVVVKMDTLNEAVKIIENLMSYGRIHTVTGVLYPDGSHESFIKRADAWLDNNRRLNDND